MQVCLSLIFSSLSLGLHSHHMMWYHSVEVNVQNHNVLSQNHKFLPDAIKLLNTMTQYLFEYEIINVKIN